MVRDTPTGLPNFLVIGAPKCGTTSLYYYLKQHPDIFLPQRKELHFFSYPYMREFAEGPGDRDVLATVCKSLPEYSKYYSGSETYKAVGDISPSYFYYTPTIKKIIDTLDNPRIILTLRDPIQKTFSQYMHLVRDNRETLDFYSALMVENERIRKRWGALWRYAESSLFAERTKHVFDAFGRDRVKIVLLEDLVKSADEVMKEIFDFLDVDPTFRVSAKTVYNKSGTPRSRIIANLLTRRNVVKRAAEQMLPASVRLRMSRFLLGINTGEKPAMDERAREYLHDYFAEDVVELENVLSQPLNWLKKPLEDED